MPCLVLDKRDKPGHCCAAHRRVVECSIDQARQAEHATRTSDGHKINISRIAGFETPTNGFTLVNASLAVKPFSGNDRTSITLSANNIFDVDARRHASVLKDFAPLAGRDIRVTARFSL